jgi:hypothetical protein
MALLKSVDDVPGIDFYEYRDTDYYNKYTYRVRIQLPCVRYTWQCKVPEDLDLKLRLKGPGRLRAVDKIAFSDNLPALKEFVTFRNKLKKAKTGQIRIEYNTAAIFSNDLQLLKSIEQIDPILSYDYTEVKKSDFVGVKHFTKQPKHKYRIYLKGKRISDDFPSEFKDLLERMTTLYPSESLIWWLKDAHQSRGHWRYRYANPTHFIDYDDESTLSYLMLLYGEIFGKRYKLEKRPDPV